MADRPCPQLSTQAFSSHSLDLTRNFVTSQKGIRRVISRQAGGERLGTRLACPFMAGYNSWHGSEWS